MYFSNKKLCVQIMGEENEDLDMISSDMHEKTKSTAIDAFASKVSASRLGYYSDQYLPIMLRFIHRDQRKQPIINRGKVISIRLFPNTIPRIFHSCSMYENCNQ